MPVTGPLRPLRHFVRRPGDSRLAAFVNLTKSAHRNTSYLHFPAVSGRSTPMAQRSKMADALTCNSRPKVATSERITIMTTRDTPECQRQQAVLNDAFGPGLVREATAATRERVVKDLQRMGLEMAGGEVPVGTVGSHHEHVGATLNWLVSAGHSVTVKPCNYNAGAGASVALDMDEPTIFRDYSVIGALAQAVAWSQREGYTP